MISRRAFLSALAGIPIIGRVFTSAALTAADTESAIVPTPREVRNSVIWLRYHDCWELDGRMVHGLKCQCEDRKEQA